MNELDRQKYLSVLGVDTYMPRWNLPFAPISVQCDLSKIELPESSVQEISFTSASQSQPIINYQSSVENVAPSKPTAIDSFIGDILQTKKIEKPVATVTPQTVLAQLHAKLETIQPFSLSIWRPFDSMMIVDSRNTKLALPTELFLKNILQNLFPNQPLRLEEEVLRWPMIENSFSKRSLDDARNELQTWFSVQQEIRPIKHIWLMGSDSCVYLLPQGIALAELFFTATALSAATVDALILPSLNEMLQNPISKRKLYSALRRYHA